MAKNSTEGNRARTTRYRTALAARGIRPVQVMAPESAHALLRQAAGLMTREQNPLDPRAALRRVGGTNEGEDGLGPDGRNLTAELDVTLGEAAALRAGLASAEERARGLATELEEARSAGDRAGQEARERAVEAAAAIARAEVAERDHEEATRELAAVRAETKAAQERERVTQERVDALRGELLGIRGRGGWRGVLLRLAGAKAHGT